MQTLSLKKRHPFFPDRVLHIPSKRLFDIFFSLSALLLLLPLYLVITLAVVLSSKSYPFFAQKRVGRGGRIFTCYKFRTMVPNAEEKLQELLEKNPEFKKEWEEKRKLLNDPRITSIGKFLRKTSLDELPQFWNVLKGDLSVVGPRAVVMEEIEEQFKEKAQKILTLRPGITGLWQVNGRSLTTYSERVDLEEKYVEDRSFLLDLRIVVWTVPIMFNSKGAA